jgi:hypothetical protein
MEPVAVTLVPHTHWDREWYEPFNVFSERLVDMMDTLLELADRGFPHFHLDGQTALIDDYLAIRPDREPDVRRLAATGRISVGPWVTQMDEFLASGESHVRNLEMGLERARALGPPLEAAYLPDQFGHVGQMPQILRAAGIERAVVWRGVPATIARDAFRWQAPDGSEVVTEYLAFGYSAGTELMQTTDGAGMAGVLAEIVERQRPSMAGDRLLVMVGYDHAGPDPGVPARLEGARPLPEGLDATIGGIAQHLEGRSFHVELPVWRGELRSSARAHLLPNVVSGRVHQKRERGRVEALVERYAEPLAALVPRFAWPAADLERVWTLLLWNGAHDSACGCSHDQVARDVDARFASARTIAEGIVAGALAELGSRVASAGVLRFNPSPFGRDGVPGLGWRVADRGATTAAVVDAEPADGGWILRGGPRIRLLDEPDVGDLYNFCPERPDQAAVPPSEVSVRDGTLVARFDDQLTVEVTCGRREGEPAFRVEGLIHNDRPDHRVRLLVELPGPAGGSIAGSPFELVERPILSEGGELESPSATWPARGVVMAGGLALLHEGVFEYEVVEGRELAVTLLRCVGTISRQELATRPFPAGPDVPTPAAQMIGITPFALGVWSPADLDGLLPTWERFALPVLERPAPGGGSLPDTGSLLDIVGDVQLSGVRRRGETVEATVWNHRADRSVEATVAGRTVSLGPARIERVTVG